VGEPKAVVSPRSREIYDGIVTDLRALFAEWGLAPAAGAAALRAAGSV
jgi:hypothetical protein